MGTLASIAGLGVWRWRDRQRDRRVGRGPEVLVRMTQHSVLRGKTCLGLPTGGKTAGATLFGAAHPDFFRLKDCAAAGQFGLPSREGRVRRSVG